MKPTKIVELLNNQKNKDLITLYILELNDTKVLETCGHRGTQSTADGSVDTQIHLFWIAKTSVHVPSDLAITLRDMIAQRYLHTGSLMGIVYDVIE